MISVLVFIYGVDAEFAPVDKFPRILAGGLFALFLAAITQALSIFGVIAVALGHLFMAVAWVAGSAIIVTELIPLKPARHKALGVIGLFVVILAVDLWAAQYKSKLSEPVVAPIAAIPKSPDKPETQKQAEPKNKGQSSEPKSGATKVTGSIFIDCRIGPMPYTFPESGHVYVLNPLELPDSNGGGGLTDNFSKPGGDIKWNNTGIPEMAYRCEIVNYYSRALFNAQITFHLVFSEVIRDAEITNAYHHGRVTIDRHWLVPIPRIDPGASSSFVFYIWNCCLNRFIQIDMPDSASGTLQGDISESTIVVTKAKPGPLGWELQPFRQ